MILKKNLVTCICNKRYINFLQTEMDSKSKQNDRRKIIKICISLPPTRKTVIK
jgi:hypothetical protein